MEGSSSLPSGMLLSIVPTRWLKPNGDGLKVDTASVHSGGTLKGCLRGIIQPDIENNSLNLNVIDTIRLTAHIPGLDTQPNTISSAKTITIQYPLKLDMLHCPEWIAPATTTVISWKVSITKEGLTLGHQHQ